MAERIDTPQKIRFLKYIFEKGEGIKPGIIADKFGIRTATVSRSLHELIEAGYISSDTSQKIYLSETGYSFARFLYRRHRILALMLTRSGLSESDACLQAEKIEHLVSRENIDIICRSLGHPSRAACGVIEHDPECCGRCA